jgi:hypothetical protein
MTPPTLRKDRSMPTTNADNLLHAFRTFLGMPPDADTPPACGAVLTSGYNGRNKPHCPECDRLVAAARKAVRS